MRTVVTRSRINMPRAMVLLLLLLAALAMAAAKRRRERKTRTDVPSLVWHAPFFSGGGYCSEGTAFVVALDDMRLDVAIEMHGDSHNNDYMNGLNPTTLGRLYTLAGRAARQRVEPSQRGRVQAVHVVVVMTIAVHLDGDVESHVVERDDERSALAAVTASRKKGRVPD